MKLNELVPTKNNKQIKEKLIYKKVLQNTLFVNTHY